MTAAAPVANARMYSATPETAAAWKSLLTWVLARAGLDWPVVDYPPPAPLNALWARDDLGLAMMCGLPFAQRDAAGGAGRPQLVAAPVPAPPRYAGRPVYFTDIVVRADAPFQTLADTFGGTAGYTLADSMSGGVALRCHLAAARAARGARLYARAVGGLIHARGVIEALARGAIDVGPLDSYYHDLLVQNAPHFAAQVRTVATTAARPIPPLVATAGLDGSVMAALRAALAEVATEPALAGERHRLRLAGFAVPQAADYAPLAAMAAADIPSFEEL
ncbi:PhnD/SsuA/transferrin family substrate-binding protein [Pseudacidovorax intermedius]|uniref:Phosphate ABC transporter substrate-binding protein n=1 Tax=Pseudacidovorax intermedius TaxID=433924 RepID=A0A147GQV2_9BURK|nr:PhnD/SsuA/transferrin family substrate-binding protein [Pseudacidovorax intermedius]KTT17819.1 phosphate ABC transporter substrate-binding protein [Pseudacidovorax intermedius]